MDDKKRNILLSKETIDERIKVLGRRTSKGL